MNFKIAKILLVLIFILAGSVFLVSKLQQKLQVGSNRVEAIVQDEIKDGKFYVDLNGDGNKDYVVLTQPDNEMDRDLKAMVAYDVAGKEVGRFPRNLPLKVPADNTYKIYKLDTKKEPESFSFDFIAGPHQSETMFFELRGGKIMPICLTEIVKSAYDCLFYSDNMGNLAIKDLDNDGLVEVIELVNEYPANGKLSSEESSAIDKAFKEPGVNEFAQGAKRIAIRGKGGGGRTVVWAVYSYNKDYFVPQTGKDYDKYYNLIGDLIGNKMRKSGLSKDSLDYIEFARNFWTKK